MFDTLFSVFDTSNKVDDCRGENCSRTGRTCGRDDCGVSARSGPKQMGGGGGGDKANGGNGRGKKKTISQRNGLSVVIHSCVPLLLRRPSRETAIGLLWSAHTIMPTRTHNIARPAGVYDARAYRPGRKHKRKCA